MSTSANPPAPARSPRASASLSRDMVGSHVELFRLYRKGLVSGVDSEGGQESLISFIPNTDASEGIFRMETKDGLTFQGRVKTSTDSEASILVKDDSVRSCRCCRTLGVPAPPFSPSMVGMEVHFSEPYSHTFEASVLDVERWPRLSLIDLEMTSRSVIDLEMTRAPPYSLHMGDTIIVRSGMDTWKGTVMYFEDDTYVKNLQNKIRIHVPERPKSLPYTKISVRPAHPLIGAFTYKCKEDSQRKRRSSAHQENEANQRKIKVAINGYGDVGRALARVALESEDVELVAINDPIDEVSCMFKNSKCDFEVKNGSGILLFGKKEVRFFRESDPSTFWFMVKNKFVVTSSYCSEKEESDKKNLANKYRQTSDPMVCGPLEMILGPSNCSTPLNNSWASILPIRPINPPDAKAVSNCFPVWKGKRTVSVVCFQGIDVVFVLEKYPDYALLPNKIQPSIGLTQLVRCCFHMLSRVPNAVCDVELSEWPRRG